MRVASLINMPGALMVGLGIHAVAAKEGKVILPILNDSSVVTGLFVVGGVIMGWSLIQFISVIQRRAQLRNDLDA